MKLFQPRDPRYHYEGDSGLHGFAYEHGNSVIVFQISNAFSTQTIFKKKSENQTIETVLLENNLTEGNLLDSHSLPAGSFHPRIWRPGCCPPFYLVGQPALSQAIVSASVLIRQMQEIFLTVEPVLANDGTYGHQIRNLLLLASMEVESHLRGILRANDYQQGDELRWKTADYVKLLKPMLLDCYDVRLSSYPNWPLLCPFEGWDVDRPTKSLDWYNAYNAVKHDRESKLSEATFSRAINAVAAVIVLIHAQADGAQPGENATDTFRNDFDTVFKGKHFPMEYYVPSKPFEENGLSNWRRVPLIV